MAIPQLLPSGNLPPGMFQNDVDIVLLSTGPDETLLLKQLQEAAVDLDLLDIFVDTTEYGFAKMVDFFAHERSGQPKGIIILAI